MNAGDFQNSDPALTIRTASGSTVTYNNSGQPADVIEIEAAPADITISLEGPRHRIYTIDQDMTDQDDVLALYTYNWGADLVIPASSVAVQVDAASRVTAVINPSVNGKPPVWADPTPLSIPAGGYVLVARDSSYANPTSQKYLAANFEPGDTVKLRKNNLVVLVKDLVDLSGPISRLSLNNYAMYTETKPEAVLSGTISNMEDPAEIEFTVNGTVVPVEAGGAFRYSYVLNQGINYLNLIVKKSGEEQDSKDLVIFGRPGFASDKKVILWVDQAANARKLQSSENVRDFVKKAADNGTTSIVFDVKGVEGFASYKKNTLTGRPYVSEIKAPVKAGSNPDLDLLEEFVRYSREFCLDIHAAVNIFAEGSIAFNEFAILNDHLDWEERVYNSADNGQIMRQRESAKQGAVAFINPSNEEARQFQLRTIEEVIQNYDIDGVVLDRARYDNETSDFSDLTKGKFESFVQEKGKTLQNWPGDVLRYENKVRVNGPLIHEWWEFRSKTIKSFTTEVKALADSYEGSKGKPVQVSAYVGSWFESYYLNGVHWGSTEFRYDSRLGMKDEDVYRPGYYESGYIENLDFIMIGAYQTTGPEVERHITLGNIVINGEKPLYTGIALTNVPDPALQREILQAGLDNTHGLMLFDASQVNWPITNAALRDLPYVKDYQLGVSLPNQTESFLEGSYYDVNVIENNIDVLTDSFGYSTGNNRFGVEAVIDSSGKVISVPNKTKAMNEDWSNPDETNSVIPKGGFVVSAKDLSGVGTKRQLIANSFETGDAVRSAVLSGFLAYEGVRTGDDNLDIEGQVKVLGPGNAEVYVNGRTAKIKKDGSFTGEVDLKVGVNAVTVTVKVDGFKTNEKKFDIIRDENVAESV
ncbi:family 10 glycosylhydrolase [Paenibacillus lutrae]|uniref:family 10 glycosylhydrolase n=1 Tax=Paenibacillus lutrae TaxID=2078573 RepID=UPI0030845E51